jgi:hypothetical protein
MEIDLKPPMHGCLLALVTVLTLGLYPLLRKMGEGHFIKRMDESGFETRAGKRFAWSEVRRIQRHVGKVRGVSLSDELILFTDRGRASLPTWRAGNPEAAAQYLLSRAPEPQAKE